MAHIEKTNTEQALIDALSCFGTDLITADTAKDGSRAVRYLGDRQRQGGATWLESQNAVLSDCSVIYPAGNISLQRVSNQISQAFSRYLGAKVNVCDDSTSPGEHEILLGPVNRPAYKSFADAGLNPLRTSLRIANGQLIVASFDATNSEIAASQFLRYLKNAALFSDRFDLPADFCLESIAYRGGDGSMTAGANTRVMSFNLLANEWGGPALPGIDNAAVATILTYRPTVAG